MRTARTNYCTRNISSLLTFNHWHLASPKLRCKVIFSSHSDGSEHTERVCKTKYIDVPPATLRFKGCAIVCLRGDLIVSTADEAANLLSDFFFLRIFCITSSKLCLGFFFSKICRLIKSTFQPSTLPSNPQLYLRW